MVDNVPARTGHRRGNQERQYAMFRERRFTGPIRSGGPGRLVVRRGQTGPGGVGRPTLEFKRTHNVHFASLRGARRIQSNGV